MDDHDDDDEDVDDDMDDDDDDDDKFKLSTISVQWTPKIWGKLPLNERVFEKLMVWQAS